jgi:hypothetical protein
MKKIIIVFVLNIFIVAHAHTADRLFFTLNAIPTVDDEIGSSGAEEIPIVLDQDLATQLTDGQELNVPLLDGQIVLGTVKQETTNLDGETIKVVSFDNGKGGLQLTIDDSSISELLLFDKDKTKFYRAELDTNGVGAFIEEDPNEHI